DGSSATDLVIVVGGTPATLSGKVSGDDVGGTTLTVQLPLDVGILAGGAGTTQPAAAASTGRVVNAAFALEDPPAASAIPEGAVVATVPIASDGEFGVTGLPSPGIFDVVITKPGFATTVQRVDVSAGEVRKDIDVVLTTGDGTISGTVEGK